MELRINMSALFFIQIISKMSPYYILIQSSARKQLDAKISDVEWVGDQL
jgi:hypothetical protein